MTNPDAVLTIGSRVHYSGDICNDGGWFEVTAIQQGSKFYPVESYDLTEIGGCGRVFLRTRHIGTVYAGHCDPRFVTAEAVETYRAKNVRGACRAEGGLVMRITWIERSDDGGATWRIYCQSVKSYRTGENIVLQRLLRDLKKYGGDEMYREEVA